MPNKEENIDRFVRKVVEHYDVQYDETHWEALEKKLDKEMPVVTTPAGTGVSTIVLSVISGMAIMFGILWFSGALDPIDADVQNRDSQVIAQPESKTDEMIVSDGSARNSTANMSDNQRPISTRSNRNDDGGAEVIGYLPSQNVNRQAYFTFSEPDSGKKHDHLILESKPYNHTIPLESYALIERKYYESRPDHDKQIIKPVANRKPIQLGIALSGAPDFNGVGIQSDKEASWQLGLQLFATYKERLSLSTGVSYNKKRYTTQGEDYFPPSGYWNRYTNGVIPDEVFGYCAVLDVPINLTYHWNPQKRLQFLSSIGISNYFILGEDYHYRFFDPNSGAAEGWETDEMTKQMFGVGNVSVGILWYVRPRIGIKLEPYLKIPLKEIGWGRVELYSTGTLLSIQYIFNKK